MGRPAVRKGRLDACLQFAGANLSQGELGKGFEVGDLIGDFGNVGSKLD